MPYDKLKIAIQKSGRLSDGSIQLLKNCDIAFDNGSGKLKSVADNFPLEILFLRDDDITRYIDDGVADVGIIGENVLAEQGSEMKGIIRLGFGRCRLSVAFPKSVAYSGLRCLEGKKIATSYPKLLKSFLVSNSIEADVHTIGGSVEIAPSVGLADAICDLVSSGSTLFSNGLREVETVMESEAVLVSSDRLDVRIQKLADSLAFRIKAVIAARENKYILLNAPNDKLEAIVSLLPGMKSPTIMPLAESGWSSLHSVVGRNDHWRVVEQLKAEGAEGILVISIDQMIQ